MSKTSQYRGVTWSKHKDCWQIKLKRSGHKIEQVHFGYYQDPERAARIRDALVVEIWGNDAILNFDGQPPPDMCRVDIVAMLNKKGWR